MPNGTITNRTVVERPAPNDTRESQNDKRQFPNDTRESPNHKRQSQNDTRQSPNDVRQFLERCPVIS
jgi:hypothetical protein